MKDEDLKVLFDNYFEEIHKVIERIKNTQIENISKIADLVANTFVNDGLVHVFGTGHSQLLVNEICYRAGELANLNPLLDMGVYPGGGPKATILERLEGYAKIIFDSYDIGKKDIMIIISNSGINAVPIEMAMETKKKGVKVIAITSSEFRKVPSRHSSGKYLSDIADIALDNYLARGDGVMKVEGVEQKMAPISGIVNTFILHLIMREATQKLIEQGITPPIWSHANVPGSDEKNLKLIQKYKNRIKIL